MHYDGTAWMTVKLPTSAHINSVWGTGPNDVFAVGEQGIGSNAPAFLHYDGQAWSSMTYPNLPVYAEHVGGSGPADVYAICYYHNQPLNKPVVSILRYDGSAWKQMASGKMEGMRLNGICGSGARNIYAVGDDAMILHHYVPMFGGIVDMGTLSIDTTPVKGEVFVNGASWGTAPQSQPVSPGQYTVSFGAVAGYLKPPDQQVTVSKSQTATVLGEYPAVTPVGAPCGFGTPWAFLPLLLGFGFVKRAPRRRICG